MLYTKTISSVMIYPLLRFVVIARWQAPSKLLVIYCHCSQAFEDLGIMFKYVKIMQSVPCKRIRHMLLFYLVLYYIYFSLHRHILFFFLISYLFTSSFLSQLSFNFSYFCVSLNFLWAFLRLFLSPPPPFSPSYCP